MRNSGIFLSGLAISAGIAACSSHDSPPAASAKPPAVAAAATPPARHLSLHLRTPAKDGQCPAVSVRIEPVRLQGLTHSGGDTESFTDLQLKPVAGESPVANCEGAALSAAVVYGQWRLTVPLPSGVASCDREVSASTDPTANFVDGHAGCE